MKFFKIALLSIVFFSPDILLAKAVKPISVKEKKKRFLNTMFPIINSVYKELDKQYKDIKKNIDNPKYKQRISALKKTYKVKSNKELLMALKPHPKSLTLAQAALESAWGTSRFYKKANNIFGIWSFNKKEPRIAAAQKRDNRTIWLKRYPSRRESVRDYYKNLSRSSAYAEFRELKMKTNDPYKLVKKLDRYSELREKYTKEVAAVMKHNKLHKYD